MVSCSHLRTEHKTVHSNFRKKKNLSFLTIKKIYLRLFWCDYSRMELLIIYVHSFNTVAINQILCFRKILYREWDKNKSVHQLLCINSLASYGRQEF
jgi:hypothetical protein